MKILNLAIHNSVSFEDIDTAWGTLVCMLDLAKTENCANLDDYMHLVSDTWDGSDATANEVENGWTFDMLLTGFVEEVGNRPVLRLPEPCSVLKIYDDWEVEYTYDL